MEKQEQIQRCENVDNYNNAYSFFLYGIRSTVTRDYYLRRLRIFFNHIKLVPDETMERRCNFFAAYARNNPNLVVRSIIEFLQYQRERVERKEIVSATLRNFLKPIKLFCEMSDIPIPWKKITRGLPKVKRYADDRAPTFDEIKKICDYPDRRMRSIICTMSSSGIRLGAWDYLQWRHIIPIEYDGKIIAAKIVVYAGTEDEYYSFTTPEAYYELEKWINFRKDAGEMIDEASWLMVQLWNTKSACIPSHKIKSVGIKQLVTRSLKTCGVRNKKRKQSDNGYGTRYEFQTNHGFRKWFKTRCELAGKAERKNFTPLLVDVNAKSSTIPDDIEGGYFSSAGNSQFQLTGKGTDYPPECYYCNQAFNGIDKKAYEKHVLVNHPKMQCYPGPADIEFYKLTPKGMDWEK